MESEANKYFLRIFKITKEDTTKRLHTVGSSPEENNLGVALTYK